MTELDELNFGVQHLANLVPVVQLNDKLIPINFTNCHFRVKDVNFIPECRVNLESPNILGGCISCKDVYVINKIDGERTSENIFVNCSGW